MAPGAKRKRGDRSYSHDSHDGSNRPSPHRPGDLALAHQSRGQGQYGHHHNSSFSPQHGARGGRRNPRGGRGGYQGQQMNGSHGADEHSGARRETRPLDQAANPQPANAATSVDTAMSPPPSASHPQNSTPRPSQQPSTPAPPPQAQPPAPPKTPPPYHFKIITDDRLRTWDVDGRASVISVLIQAYASNDPITTGIVFQEILRAGLDGRIEAAEAGKLIADSLAAEPIEADVDPAELFLDTLSILTDSEPAHPRIQPLVLATGISPSLMREVLEVPVLQTLGLIRPSFNQIFIRKQTNILYKQSNYNLLREETEGYSKLVTELFTTTNSEPPTAEVVEDTFENIKSLIGAFDLDAGRVLDVTLDVFASLLVKHYRFFVKLLRTSSWWPNERFYGLQTEGQGFGGLPVWAQPNHSSWLATEQEKADVAQLKNDRDRIFWDRARELGMDAYFELGGRRVVGDHDLDALIDLALPDIADDVRAKETREWVKRTKTLPPGGNPVAAQLLGFKLRFYSSAARDAHDVLPVNLIYLAALLIKIGFISLRDLYPHLFPEDESMGIVKEKMMREKEEREMAKRPGGGALNALAKAGALADDTLPQPPAVGRLRESTTRASTPAKSEPTGTKSDSVPPKAEDEEKEQLPEPSDQKVQLLRSLLCIGAIQESLFLLGRFTWLPDAFPDLPEHIHRLLHHSLNNVYDPLRPLQECEGIREAAPIPATDQAGVPKGDVKMQEAPPIKILRWAQLDKNDIEGIDYRFYWDDWSDNVPMCQSVDDVFTLCNTLLNLSGVKIGLDTSLLIKLARIGKYSLSEDFSQPNQARWTDLCKRLLAPALSLTKANPGVVNEVYDLLKLFPTPTRYSIYNEWFLGATSRLPDLDNAFSLTRAETKDTLRRMTKTNQRLMARNLAKVACASPGIVFQVVFGQIESYQNLIDVVVECARYFTYMGYDILTWSLLSSLGKAGRSRVSERNGINVSQWLISLSKFSGKVSKRYSVMNPLPLLQYVLQQLCHDNFADLQVLRELIFNMAGIMPDTDFTDAQIQAMAGGELLQGQILQQLQDKRHESKTAGKRLMKTIVDHDLTGSLLVAIAQQRQRCIFNENNTQLKVIGENFDSVHIVLTQYHDMLRHNLSVKEFDQLVPDICSLISNYGVEPSIAFMIHRKSILKAMEEYDAAHPPAKKRSSESSTGNARSEGVGQSQSLSDQATSKVMEDVEMAEATALGETQLSTDLVSDVAEMSQQENETAKKDGTLQSPSDPAAAKPLPSAENQTTAFKWHPVVQDIIDRIRDVLPADFEKTMSLAFYVSFWQLALNDLTLPTQSYNEEISRQKEQLAAINADRTDVSSTGLQKKEKDRKAVNDFLGRLTEEMKNSVTKHSQVRQRLDKEKQYWFEGFGKGARLVNSLLQECFLPRMLMSPLDSQYTWRMFNMLHSSGTPGFRTSWILDRLFDEQVFSNILFHCTGREVENFGRFLNEVFKELGSWHANKTEYEKRAFGPKRTLIGFARTLTDDGKPKTFYEYEDFRRLLYKWHSQVQRAIKSALVNDEYMHIRNACVVLRAISRHYPVVNWMAKALVDIIQKISSTEEVKKESRRDDIWVLSTSVLGNLKSRQKHWVLPQAFRIPEKNLGDEAESARARSSAPKTPQPDKEATGKALNAEAPTFEPKTSETKPVPPTNGEPKATSAGKGEVEDGELEDMVTTDASVPTVAVQEASAASTPAAEQTTSTLASAVTAVANTDTKRDEVAEMRARVKASADAKRRQSQAASTAVRPSAAEGDPAKAVSQPKPTASTSAPQTPGSSAAPAANDRRSTPAAETHRPNSNMPTRAEFGNSTSTPTSTDRQPHALPTRPDTQPFQRGRYPQRPNDVTSVNGPERPDNRGRPPQDVQRQDRSGEIPSQRPNDRNTQPIHRSDAAGSYQRGDHTSRHPDAANQDARGYRQGPPEFAGRAPPRDVRPAGREHLDSRPSSARGERAETQQGLNSRQEPASSEHLPPGGSSSVPPTPSESANLINPERAAKIYQSETLERHSNNSRQSDAYGESVGANRPSRSRPQSPTRSDTRSSDSRREGRMDGGRAASYESRPPRDIAFEHTPNGPRNGPPPRPDLMQPPPPRTHDRGSGRFPQEYTPRSQARFQDDNYGRLNADPGTPQSGQVTSAAEERGLRSEHPRNANGHAGPGSRRQSSEMQSGHSQPFPSQASARPSEQRGQQQGASSAPPTPSADGESQDLSGIHPSRQKAFTQSGPPQPAPIQTGGGSGQGLPPPSGPRSAQSRGPETPTSSASVPSPGPRNAPAGPTNVGERRTRDGSARRQFAEMQQTLSQSGQQTSSSQSAGTNVRPASEQGTSIRGRAAGRQQQQQTPTDPAPPASEARPAQNGPPEGAAEPSREAISSGPPPPRERVERDGANLRNRERSPQRETRARNEGSREYRQREEQAPRSHRGLREQSRDTRGEPQQPQDIREQDAGRDRGGSGKDQGRALRGSGGVERERGVERDQRDPGAPPPPRGGYETRHRGSDRAANDRDRERDRERREPASYPSRGPGGGGGWGGSEPSHPASANRERRGDGRERREPSGQKRGWGADEGGSGAPKRQRRVGN